MKNRIKLLCTLYCSLLLWGCATDTVQLEPTSLVPSTQISTPRVLPSPRSTVLVPTSTKTRTASTPTTPIKICQPGELEAYLAEFSPVGDQMVLVAQEATALEALSESRAKEMAATVQGLKTELSEVTVPTCLESAHGRAMDAVTLLESAVSAILGEDFDLAEEMLQESFSTLSEAVALTAVLLWELTATSTASP
jgi:hypothetical protein